MAKTYRTISGDTWSVIAYKALGNSMYMDKLIKSNLEHKDIFLFPAGVILTLPEISAKVSEALPPWRK